MSNVKAGDLLTVLQLAVALNFTFGGIFYFVDIEISRAKACVQELRSLFNTEPNENRKLLYGNSLLRAQEAFFRVQVEIRTIRPVTSIIAFAIFGLLSFVLLIISTLIAQLDAPPGLVVTAILLAIIPSSFFFAVSAFSISVISNIQAILSQTTGIRVAANDRWI
jgi:hypothetical protein